nr:hypothetical protein [Micromonospora sp. DSM 115978]
GGVSPLLAGALACEPDRWLGQPARADWMDAEEQIELRALGLRLTARLRRLGHQLDPDVVTRAGVCFGGLIPQHVIYPAGNSRPVLISPALGSGGEVVDLGMLLSRVHLLLAGARPVAGTARQVAEGVEAWMCARLAAGLRGWQEWTAAVLTMWAADLLGVFAETLAIRPGALPLTPSTVAAARRAVEVLTAVDAVVGVLLRRGADPALNAAFEALATAPGANPAVSR